MSERNSGDESRDAQASDEQAPTAAGRSSFDLVDGPKLFAELGLGADTRILDLGSGVGNYSLAASEYMGMGGSGRVYAVDLWEEGIEALASEAEKRGMDRIVPIVADVGARIPLEDETVDVCLIATVLHDLVVDGVHDGALREVRRVLMPGGRLAIVEFEKVEGPPGPPVGIRLAPEEVEKIVESFGFQFLASTDLGLYHYLSIFTK